MELQNFSSIFEIFAAFTLAYILIDEISENPFISIITEKILRIYRSVHEVFFGIRSVVNGHKTSLNALAQLELEDDKIKNGWNEIKNKLDSTDQRAEQSYSEIRGIIKENYSTKVFVYLNCYLFYYCITLLFFGGAYKELTLENLEHNTAIDRALLAFNFGTLLFLIAGWIFDKKRSSSGFREEIYKTHLFNGYSFSTLIWILLVIFCLLVYWFKWLYTFPETTPWLHDGIIVFSILIPVLNFIAYILKARSRAKKCLPDLEKKAWAYGEEYAKELKIVEDFIGMCDYVKGMKIEIAPRK